MAIDVILTSNDEGFSDAERIIVNSSISEFNATSSFRALYPNHDGLHTNDFTVGEEIIIKSDKNNPTPTTTIFRGSIEDISIRGEGLNERIEITGRDFGSQLIDITVKPERYNNQTADFIVKDIMSKYVDTLTTNNVQASTTVITQITFNHRPVFDAIKQLAELANFVFYVDNDKDLHFEPKSATSSGLVLNKDNIVKAEFKQSDKDMANQVWVYGGKQFVANSESFTADGGSLFSLDFRPHNTEITVDGTLQDRGGIFELTSIPGTGTQYLVDFDQANIVFVSGATAFGLADNIPESGDAVVVNYDRGLTVAKVAADRTSIEEFGLRERVIVNKEIDDPNMAEDIARQNISLDSRPKFMGDMWIDSVANVTASNTVVVNMPNEGIVNQTYDIIEAIYEFDKNTRLTEQVLKLTVSRKIKNLVDTLKELILDVKRLKAGDIDDTQTISRLEFSKETIKPKVKFFQIRTCPNEDAYIIGHQIRGVIGQFDDDQSFIGERGAGQCTTHVLVQDLQQYDEDFLNDFFIDKSNSTGTLSTPNGEFTF